MNELYKRVQDPRIQAVLAALVIVAIDLFGIARSGLWDPWETHYGEVARQMTIRSDPLDLYWKPGNGGPQGSIEHSFASKPALTFWMLAIGLEVFSVGASPNPTEMIASPWPELALRLPCMITAWAALAALGYALARLVSPRAGVLGALVLATMPQWAMVSRQALTDIFFVSPLVLAAVAWAMAWLQPDRALNTRTVWRFTIPWDRAALVYALLFVAAAIVPLAVLHQHSFDPFAWQMYGRTWKADGLRAIQRHLWLYWGLAVVALVWSLRFRRRSQAWMGMLYIAAGMSLMGKGLIGPGIIGLFVLAHLFVTGRWQLLWDVELPLGVLLFVVTCFPWHHAMALFRGERWVNEWIIQNNLQRFASGEQAQAVGGFAYYLETLGLAALPWSALVPVIVVLAIRSFRRQDGGELVGETLERMGPVAMQRFCFVWLCVSLFLISYSTTKYYHYLVPCLPPLAALIAIQLDRWLASPPRRTAAMVVGMVSGLAILVGVVRDAMLTPAWIAHLTTYLYTGMWREGAPPTTRLIIMVAPFAIGLGLWVWGRARPAVIAWLLSGVLTTGYVLGDYIPAASEAWSQKSAFEVYYAHRGVRDRIVSWWFYYRGETLYAKQDIWVMRDPERSALAELFAESEGKRDALWFITIESHAGRLRGQLPPKYRDRIEEMYRSHHYVLMRVPML